VELTNVPEEQYGTKVETALAAGAPPDLGFIGSRRWFKEGAFLPLDEMIAEQGIDLSTWNKAVIGSPGATNTEAPCRFDGKLYCLGSYTGSVMLFYNKDMFDAKGLEYPTIWPPITNDQYVELACALTDEANGVWGTANGDPVTLYPWELTWNEDGRTVEGVVNSPLSVKVHQQIAEMIQNGCAPSLNVMDPWQQGVDFFSQGKLAMVVTDFQSLFKIENNNINYGIAHVPAPQGLEPFFNVWTDGIGVFAKAAHPEEAKLFIAFQATEGQRIRVEKTGDVPVSSAVAEELNWARDIPGRQEALQVLEHARPAAFVPNRWEVVGPLWDAFGYIVSEEKTAQEALDEAAPLIQENLDREWADWER
jgi:multiple sugar transport system substrate-binding protein